MTRDQVEAQIVSEEYAQMGQRTTVCLLTVRSGYEVSGFSAVVDLATKDDELGRKYAREDAFDKLWSHLAFAEMQEAKP